MSRDKFLTFRKKTISIRGVMTPVIAAIPVDEDEYYEWESMEGDIFDSEGEGDDFF